MGDMQRLTSCAVNFCILLLVGNSAEAQSLQERLKAADRQVRCDAFFEIFDGTGEPTQKEHTERLYGKTTTEIYELLGKPTGVGVLEHKGIKWLLVSYVFETCPTKAPADAQAACRQGWKYGPSVMFRNGISVPYKDWDQENGVMQYQVTPEYLRFKSGGQFP